MAYELRHNTIRRILPGTGYPLGASVRPDGVNFALYSRHAAGVFLLLFDRADADPTDIIELKERTRYVWHAFVHGAKAGQLYAYKVRGEFKPEQGLRFNERKLLIDPYAKALSGKAANTDNLLLAYDPNSPDKDRSLDMRDNTLLVPKSIVIDDAFDWQGDKPPGIPFEQLVVYEVHAKGFTAHPSSGVAFPGTCLGFMEKIPHLKSLGVNAVELLPVHEIYVEDFLTQRGLTNYWGYSTLGYFAPESSYSTQRTPGCAVHEFKTMVRALHKAGIEVILDVVYNHTGEGSELGPTFSLRGIDNPSYYALAGPEGERGRYYWNYTGCGNSLDFGNAAAIRMVMDSLRYWVEVMHVDGFRFDLASVLGREEGRFKGSSGFFDAVAQDPVLARVKLIAEPWDLDSYEVGNFPVDWSEWNSRFRDTLRRFGKGDDGQLRDLGWRITGSADLYGDDGRSAYNSVNFITSHDGFTLNDLVSYNGKRNDANREGNTDGTNDNNSWNCGAEGLTDDEAVNRLRKQMVKNHVCALFFARGTPMMLGGDEFLRTQNGNNNAYCQDNALSWFDWGRVREHADTFAFFRKAIAFRRRYTVLQGRKFVLGRDLDDDGVPDLTWYGTDLSPPHWDDQFARTLCFRMDGDEERSTVGKYHLFVMFNADYHLQVVCIPDPAPGMRWHRVIDTSLAGGDDFAEPGREVLLSPADLYLVNPRSTVVLLAKACAKSCPQTAA